jgi:outer membrane protein TolC
MRMRNMRKASLWFGIAFVAAGCASAPGYRPSEVPVPQSFREVRDTSVAIATPPPDTAQLVRWPELGDTTLTRLISQLGQANLDVRAAEERVRGARAARTEAALEFRPHGDVRQPATLASELPVPRSPVASAWGPSPIRISGTRGSTLPGSWICSAG